MRPLRFALLVASLAACSRPEALPPSAVSRANEQPSPASSRSEPAVAAQAMTPPDAQRVVDEILKAAPQDIAPGAPEFWFGHSYTFRGVPHYTGFAYFPGTTAPAATAVLADATFLASGTGRAATWAPVISEPDIGAVGGRGRAYGIDTGRQATSSTSRDGRLVLAIPVDGAIEQGVVPKLYEVLIRTPDARWHHAGTLDAGFDDSAGCDEGRAFRCAPVRGELKFDGPRASVPDILITLRTAGNEPPQSARYGFDPNTSTYNVVH